MKIRLKGRRIRGNDPVTFKNPKGESIYLETIGSVSQDLDPGVAHALCKQFGDILEVVSDAPAPEAKMVAKAPENKMVPPSRANKAKTSEEDSPITPPKA